MAYRGDDASTALEAPTADGLLQISFGPNSVELAVAQRSLHVAGRFATLVERKQRQSLRIDGRLVVARDVPHDDLGVWIEIGDGMRRIFGVAPAPLLEPDGLAALRRLDTVAQRVRTALAELAGDIRRAVEIGHGLDKVLLADHGDRHVVYARRLFRDRARFAMAIHDDGRIVIPDGNTQRVIQIGSRFSVTVRGDYVRFADHDGTDLARVSIPWIGPEDRHELARRIGQLVDRDAG